jgi:hypothetical protein
MGRFFASTARPSSSGAGRRRAGGGQRSAGAFRLYRRDRRPLASATVRWEWRCATGEPQQENEVVIERPDGSGIIVLVNIELLRGPDGEFEGAFASFQDITGRAIV